MASPPSSTIIAAPARSPISASRPNCSAANARAPRARHDGTRRHDLNGENGLADEAGKRKGLGRGLSALLGDRPGSAPEEAPTRPGRELPIESLVPGRFQPRQHFDDAALEELAQSIREKGLLQPILVRRSDRQPGRYEIIAGERRWRAAQKARLHQVPVVIRDFTDSEALEVALIENIQRQDLNPVEEAEGYRRLMDEFAYTQEQLAKSLGRSRSLIANMLRLLSLPDEVRAMLAARELSIGQVRPLIGRADALALARRIRDGGLSARDAEKLARKESGGGTGPRRAAPPAASHADADLRALEHSLAQALGLKVALKAEGERGEVTIAFTSLEQLDDLCLRLRGEYRPPAEEDPL
ncbi:MAG: ParB/RepB/Spo0J family partition protein [Alphaproteobacteria bacterium]|nr:ParB/RepB/Spo0J family partition protein [Alphaproteobacteria bacterium]